MENSSNEIKIKLSPHFLIIYILIVLGMIFIHSDLYRDLVVIPATTFIIGNVVGIIQTVRGIRKEKR